MKVNELPKYDEICTLEYLTGLFFNQMRIECQLAKRVLMLKNTTSRIKYVSVYKFLKSDFSDITIFTNLCEKTEIG